MEQLEHASNAELLSSLAGQSVAEALLKRYGRLTSLAQASFDELQQDRGVGKSKAAAIKAAFLLAQRMSRATYAEAPLLDCERRSKSAAGGGRTSTGVGKSSRVL